MLSDTFIQLLFSSIFSLIPNGFLEFVTDFHNILLLYQLADMTIAMNNDVSVIVIFEIGKSSLIASYYLTLGEYQSI